jgi:hypothetical protein
MSKEDLKRRVCEAIRARRADIKAVAESVFAEPELGFKETKTSDKIKAEFEKLGLTCETGWGITGVRARMKGKKSKKTVATQLKTPVTRRIKTISFISSAASSVIPTSRF